MSTQEGGYVEKSQIGAVIGETNTTEISFIVDVEAVRNRPLQIGEYVAIEFGEEEAIGIITNQTRKNTEIIASLANSPESVQKMLELAVVPGSELLIADVSIQGFVRVNGGSVRIERPRYPTLPGAKVYRDPIETLRHAFGNGDITIGTLRGNPQVSVDLNIQNLVSRHFSVLAVTGAGKSYTMGVLLDEILTKMPAASIVVIDPHEDYYYFRNFDRHRVQIFTPDGEGNTIRIRFKTKNFPVEDLMDMIGIPSTASKQRDLFIRIVGEFNKDPSFNWDLKNVEERLNEMLRSEDFKADWESARGILRRIRYVVEAKFLDPEIDTPVASRESYALTRPGWMTIINTGLLERRGRLALVNNVLRRIFDAAVAMRRTKNEVETGGTPRLLGPVLIVIEEAHQFAPPSKESSKRDAQCKQIIMQIAGEGRKFGVGLGIVSQRPGKVDENVLSQCNTQINLRIVNPKDKRAIQDAAENISEDLMHDLSGLNTGEAVITGSAIRIPALVKIRNLEVTPSGADVDIRSEWMTDAEEETIVESDPDKDDTLEGLI